MYSTEGRFYAICNFLCIALYSLVFTLVPKYPSLAVAVVVASYSVAGTMEIPFSDLT